MTQSTSFHVLDKYYLGTTKFSNVNIHLFFRRNCICIGYRGYPLQRKYTRVSRDVENKYSVLNTLMN